MPRTTITVMTISRQLSDIIKNRNGDTCSLHIWRHAHTLHTGLNTDVEVGGKERDSLCLVVGGGGGVDNAKLKRVCNQLFGIWTSFVMNHQIKPQTEEKWVDFYLFRLTSPSANAAFLGRTGNA